MRPANKGIQGIQARKPKRVKRKHNLALSVINHYCQNAMLNLVETHNPPHFVKMKTAKELLPVKMCVHVFFYFDFPFTFNSK